MRRSLRPSLLRNLALIHRPSICRKWESGLAIPATTTGTQEDALVKNYGQRFKSKEERKAAFRKASASLGQSDKRRLFTLLGKSSLDTYWYLGENRSTLCRRLCFPLENAKDFVFRVLDLMEENQHKAGLIWRPAKAGFSDIKLALYTRDPDNVSTSITPADLDLAFNVNSVALSLGQVRNFNFVAEVTDDAEIHRSDGIERSRIGLELEAKAPGAADISWASPIDKYTSEDSAKRLAHRNGFGWRLSHSGQILYRYYTFAEWRLARRFFGHIANLAMAHDHEPMLQMRFMAPGDQTRVKVWWTTNYQNKKQPMCICFKDIDLALETHNLAFSYGALGIDINPEEDFPHTKPQHFIWKDLSGGEKQDSREETVTTQQASPDTKSPSPRVRLFPTSKGSESGKEAQQIIVRKTAFRHSEM